jgi:hypothetical protein
MNKIRFRVNNWRRTLSLLLLCCVGAISAGAAYAGVVAGQVGRIDTVGSGSGAPNNFDFRIFFVGSPVICNGQPWAYVNSTEVNYNTIVANVLLAKSLGVSVSLTVTQDGSGFCHLDYLEVDD